MTSSDLISLQIDLIAGKFAGYVQDNLMAEWEISRSAFCLKGDSGVAPWHSGEASLAAVRCGLSLR